MKIKVKLRSIKKYKKHKIKCLIELENNDLKKYQDRYMKLRFSSEDNLLLKQELETHNLLVIIRSAFFMLTINIIRKYFLINVCIN